MMALKAEEFSRCKGPQKGWCVRWGATADRRNSGKPFEAPEEDHLIIVLQMVQIYTVLEFSIPAMCCRIYFPINCIFREYWNGEAPRKEQSVSLL